MPTARGTSTSARRLHLASRKTGFRPYPARHGLLISVSTPPLRHTSTTHGHCRTLRRLGNDGSCELRGTDDGSGPRNEGGTACVTFASRARLDGPLSNVRNGSTPAVRGAAPGYGRSGGNRTLPQRHAPLSLCAKRPAIGVCDSYRTDCV